MTPERWQEVKGVLQAALEVAVSQRPAFLDRACGADQSLRKEVESLLGGDEQSRSSFLQSPPPAHLGKGMRLGDYEIQSLLGAGGMGEVYRARDVRLRRDVAVKVLPAAFASDAERLRRFEQEATAAAALNHPNILVVYQMGTYEGAPYLVSELLEGETLREQIKRGGLVVRRAMEYGIQIARGLAAAHEKGIVHRDLKPENLFVSKDGRVKILDFGLAKLTQPQPGFEDEAPTLGDATEPGVIMGTVGYMAPEQVRGQTADHRADIFAFGAILYEMLTGKRAFQKPTSPETLTAILNEDPPLISQLVPNLPPALQRVAHRCLEKNPEQRFQSASDLAFALEALSDSGASIPSSTAAKAATSIGLRWKAVVPTTVVLVALVGGSWLYLHSRPRLSEKDTIVLGDFANSTGDAVFDDTLKTALSVSLRQSPFLNVLSDSEVAETLQLMTRPVGARLTPEVARDLCQRAGSKAYLAGSISSLGSEYVLGLKAVNCQSGNTLAEEQVTAASKENVLDALGEAASKLRGELGESLATVQKFDVSLEQATTSSLEALKAYSLGLKARNEKGYSAALSHHQRAIALDPNFAYGYETVGVDYAFLGEAERASEYFTKAFQLREHASERERIDIAGDYYFAVTRELDKAAQAYQEEIESYPRVDGGYGSLGNVYAEQGQYERSAEITRQALRLAPNALDWYVSLADDAMALQHFDEAGQVIHEAQVRKLDSAPLHSVIYALAFLRADSAAMEEQQRWFAGNSEYESFGLALASDTEAYGGHLGKARKLTKLAVDSALRVGNKESGAAYLANLALQQAAYGSARGAQQSAAQALKLAPKSRDVESQTALAFAMAGDAAGAESLARDLGTRFPLDTQLQSLWLPAIRAQLVLDRRNPAAAVNALQVALPIEFGAIMSGDTCLYHVYERGEAYLATRQGKQAGEEFQKILDHSGIVVDCGTRVLARLGLARAYAMAGDGAKAKTAYQDFLALWKDADPEIPILKEAKAEYAKLQ